MLIKILNGLFPAILIVKFTIAHAGIRPPTGNVLSNFSLGKRTTSIELRIVTAVESWALVGLQDQKAMMQIYYYN